MKIPKNISELIRFFRSDIWRIRASGLSRREAFLIRQLRVFVLSFREFGQDKCRFRASALTYYTLLSVVPLIAMAFGIAKGFGLEQAIESQILEQLRGQEEVARWLIDFAHSFLQNTKGGWIAGIGVVVLFWTIIKVLASIETSFNTVWKVDRQRALSRKISDYLSVTLIGPIFWILSSSATVIATSRIHAFLQEMEPMSPVNLEWLPILKILPYVMTWILFTFIYMFMPNTRVRFRSALFAAVVAGTLYQVFQWVYINFQIGVSKYNAVYGSLAALPLFLVWLQTSWLIVLYGAEISFAHQNVEQFEYRHDSIKISCSFRKLMLLNVMHHIVHRFRAGKQRSTEKEIGEALGIPVFLLRQALAELVKSGLINIARNAMDGPATGEKAPRDEAYQPALDPDRLTLQYVLTEIEQQGNHEIPMAPVRVVETLQRSLLTFAELIESSPANVRLKDIPAGE